MEIAFNPIIPARYRGRKLLTTTEAAECIGREASFVVVLCETRRLDFHLDSAAGTQKSRRITMASVVAYLASTADYDPARLLNELIGVIDSFTDKTALDRLIHASQHRRSQLH